MPIGHALTVTGAGLLASVETAIEFCEGFDPNSVPADQHLAFVGGFTAIWDTGATNTVISQKVVDNCGLQPIGIALVHGVHSSEQAETYLVNVRLPNTVAFANVQVTKGKLVGADALIGMDIIRSGDFAITNINGKTVMSFRIPSQVCIDFVDEHNKAALRESFQHGGPQDRKKRPPKQFGQNKRHK